MNADLLTALLVLITLPLVLIAATALYAARAAQQRWRSEQLRAGLALPLCDASDDACCRVVQEAIATAYGECGAVESPAIVHSADAQWMSFHGRGRTLYVLSTRRQLRRELPAGRALPRDAAELAGRVHAVWRHLAAHTRQMPVIDQRTRWYALKTTVDAMRASERAPVSALATKHLPERV
jgi:hypothetical protein